MTQHNISERLGVQQDDFDDPRSCGRLGCSAELGAVLQYGNCDQKTVGLCVSERNAECKYREILFLSQPELKRIAR